MQRREFFRSSAATASLAVVGSRAFAAFAPPPNPRASPELTTAWTTWANPHRVLPKTTP